MSRLLEWKGKRKGIAKQQINEHSWEFLKLLASGIGVLRSLNMCLSNLIFAKLGLLLRKRSLITSEAKKTFIIESSIEFQINQREIFKYVMLKRRLKAAL